MRMGGTGFDAPYVGDVVSWAQNHEDMRLRRAFKGVESGTYVEIGGFDAEFHSVTKYFYDRGWSGVIVEPVPHLAEAISRARPRDHVVCAAAGRLHANGTLHVVDGTGLSSLSGEIAGQLANHGHPITTLPVRVVPAQELVDLAATSDVHFLVVDAEGWEAEILENLDFDRVRPWIVVVEAIHPVDHTTTHERWEPFLLSGGVPMSCVKRQRAGRGCTAGGL